MPATTSCDIIVIGGGSAALEAAIAASQAGAGSVVMLEKAPERESGGNARFSHTGFRFVHSGAAELRKFLPDVDAGAFARMQIPAYGREDFLGDLDRITQGRIDPVLAECLVDQSNAAVHWMREIGVRWEPEKMTEVDGKLYLPGGHHIHPVGGGPGMLDRLRALALDGPAIEPSRITPQLFILAAIVVFALTIERLGLALAVALVALTAAFASRDMRWVEAIALALGLAALCVLLFVHLLGQPFTVWAF